MNQDAPPTPGPGGSFEFDLFGDPLSPLPDPIKSGIPSPDQVLEMISNGKIAETREEFLGLPPKINAETEKSRIPEFFAPPKDHPTPTTETPATPESFAPPEAPARPQVTESDPTSRPFLPSPAPKTPLGKNRDAQDSFSVPRLEVTNGDIDKFLSCIKNGTYYSEVFRKGEFSVTFRVKSALEITWMRACTSNMIYTTKELLSTDDLNYAILRFNLLFQVVKINNEDCQGVTPPGIPPWAPEHLNLEALFWQSKFSKMSEISLFMIQSMMVQFEQKVRDIETAVIDPKFSSEEVHS